MIPVHTHKVAFCRQKPSALLEALGQLFVLLHTWHVCVTQRRCRVIELPVLRADRCRVVNAIKRTLVKSCAFISRHRQFVAARIVKYNIAVRDNLKRLKQTDRYYVALLKSGYRFFHFGKAYICGGSGYDLKAVGVACARLVSVGFFRYVVRAKASAGNIVYRRNIEGVIVRAIFQRYSVKTICAV